VRTVLDNSGLDFYCQLPKENGSGSQMDPNIFRGHEVVIGGDGDSNIDISNITADEGVIVIKDTGGTDIYILDKDKSTYIIEDNNSNTEDNIIIEGLDPQNASYERRGDDLIIYGSPSGGRPIAIVKDHFGSSGPKLDEIGFDDGTGPVFIPTENLD